MSIFGGRASVMLAYIDAKQTQGKKISQHDA